MGLDKGRRSFCGKTLKAEPWECKRSGRNPQVTSERRTCRGVEKTRGRGAPGPGGSVVSFRNDCAGREETLEGKGIPT